MILRPALLVVAAALALPGDTAGPNDILGKWYGTSTCVKESGNASCHDEIIRYTFTNDSSDSSLKHQVADKLVDGQWELMGELTFAYDPASLEWNGDFENSRVKIRWVYRVRGDTLTGEVIRFPDRAIGRHVLATRTPLPGHP